MLLDIPQELRSLKQWINWRSVSRDGKNTKVPVCPANPGYPASITDPKTWSDFASAYLAVKHGDVAGLGFVFTDSDPYFGMDMDHVLIDGKIPPLIVEVLAHLKSYTEISPSGQGLHIIAKGKLPPGRRKSASLEIYESGRYFTMTGNIWDNRREVVDCSDSVATVHHKFFAQPEFSPQQHREVGDLFHLPQGSRHDEILDRIRRMRKGGMEFEDIMQLATIIAEKNGLSNRLAEVERMVRWAAINIKPDPRVQAVESMVEYVYDIADLDNWKCNPVEWLIPGIIQRGSMILCAGESQTGKSMFMSYLSTHLAAGAEVFSIPVTKAKVLYLCLEDKVSTIQARLREFRSEIGTSFDPGQFTMAFWYNFNLLGDNLTKIEKRLTDEHVDMLVIDTYQRATTGHNSFADEIHTKIYHSLSKITRSTGTSIVMIDHLRKAEASVGASQTGPRRLSMDDVRGSGVKVQNTDTVILMSRWDNLLRVDVRSKDLHTDNVLNLEISRHSPKYRVCQEDE